jgi:hypothetical protein
MLAFKRRVSKYFTKRNLLLQKLNRKGISAEDDYAELYVLMRIVQLAKRGVVYLTTDYKGKRYYTVATSPSPKWSNASHFLLNGKRGDYALRTGLEVKVSDGGTVELDVVLIEPSNINNDMADGMKLGGFLGSKKSHQEAFIYNSRSCSGQGEPSIHTTSRERCWRRPYQSLLFSFSQWDICKCNMQYR